MKILLFANTDWYLYNFRLPLARMLSQRGHAVTLLSPRGTYAPKMEADGFRWAGIALSRRGMNPVAELQTVLRLRRLYQAEKPDIVHHFTPKCILYGSLAARWSGVGAVVNSITGLGYLFAIDGWRGRLIRNLVSSFYRFALRGTQVVFQNPEDMQMFADKGIVSPQTAGLIPSSGVDLDRLTPSPEPEGVPVVLLAARLLWDKGVGEFVEAARLLAGRGIQVRFALAGRTDPGNPSSIPAARIASWRDERAIEWWGWQEDMPSALARSNIVCLPSYYREGVPRILVEAAACGRALIASDIAGCREIVRAGYNGLLVPTRDPQALADAICVLARDVALRGKMGANGHRLVQEHFSAEQVNRATLEVYARATKAGSL
jgi:glycosyltransferase involved in cell wall biosynthesis